MNTDGALGRWYVIKKRTLIGKCVVYTLIYYINNIVDVIYIHMYTYIPTQARVCVYGYSINTVAVHSSH